MNTSLQAAGRLTADHSPAYPWRAVVMVEWYAGSWSIMSVFEMETEEAAEAEAAAVAISVLDDPSFAQAHYYVGLVAQ